MPQQEWVEVVRTYCKIKGYEVLFINSDNFGFATKSGQLVHMYAEELEADLKAHPVR